MRNGLGIGHMILFLYWEQGEKICLNFNLSSARLPFEQNYYIAAENRIGNKYRKNGEKDKTMICWFCSKGKNGRNREKRIS